MTLTLLGEICAEVACPVAALPVPYRTTPEHPTSFNLPAHGCSCLPQGHTFHTAPEPLACNRYEIVAFARAAHEMRIYYLGVFCGAAPIYICALVEALGRAPRPSAYSLDMSKHVFFGTERCAQISPHRRSGSHVTLGSCEIRQPEIARFS
jgi:betaine-homocysteine S-methyltransferase